MDIILSALALAALALGAYAAARRARDDPQDPSPQGVVDPDDRDLSRPERGDILLADQTTFTVREVLHCRDGERSWREARLDHAGQPHWMVIDEQDGPTLWLGQRIAIPPIIDVPSQQLDHAGHIFRLKRWGCADRHNLTLPGNDDSRRLDYWDYTGPGARRLWLRRHGENTTCFAGEQRARHDFELLPYTSRSEA